MNPLYEPADSLTTPGANPDAHRRTAFAPVRHRRLLRWIAAALLGALVSANAWAVDILLTSSEDTASLHAFVSALAQHRPQDHVQFTPLDKMPRPGRLPARTRLILLDPPSLDWRLQDTQGPITLVLRISRVEAHQRLGESRPADLSLLWSDPPVARQLNLIRQLTPQATRIGVLFSGKSQFMLDELRRSAKAKGLRITAQPWTQIEDTRPLQALLKRSDALLGLDDAELYNPKTAKGVLLSSYARKQPVWGPTASFVKAGSLASTYSDQNDWLLTLDTLLDQPQTRWPRALYPSHFKVTSNPQVARSLGISPIDDVEIARRIAAEENRP